MKGNILRMLNESEKRRIVGMHTSHKNQKLDDEAKRLSKLFGYRINESAIRGYLITEAVTLTAANIPAPPQKAYNVLSVIINEPAISAAIETIAATLTSLGIIFNTIDSKEAAQYIFCGYINLATAKNSNLFVDFAKRIADQKVKNQDKLTTMLDRLGEAIKGEWISGEMDFDGTYDFKVNPSNPSEVMTMGTIDAVNGANQFNPASSSLVNIVKYVNSYNLIRCKAIFPNADNSMIEYPVFRDKTDRNVPGYLDFQMSEWKAQDRLYIWLWGLTNYKATKGGTLKVTKVPASVKVGDIGYYEIDEAFAAGQLGPIDKAVTDAATALKAMVDDGMTIESISVMGTADGTPFKSDFNQKKFLAMFPGTTDLPQVYPGAGQPGEYDDSNYTSSANSWLAYNRGKNFVTKLTEKLSSMGVNLGATPVVKGRVDPLRNAKRMVLMDVVHKKKDEIIPAQTFINVVGGQAGSSEDIGQYAQCNVYNPDWTIDTSGIWQYLYL